MRCVRSRASPTQIEHRDIHSLSPLAAADLPAEVSPLVEELNRLLARLSAAFASQRAFVADAAHELRSPLTALSLQLQLLERARDEPERELATTRLRAAIDRATHLVSQLLTLARNEPEGAPGTRVPHGAGRWSRAMPSETCSRWRSSAASASSSMRPPR